MSSKAYNDSGRINRKNLIASKYNNTCERCATRFEDSRMFDFHHVDPSQKLLRLTSMWFRGLNGIPDKVLEEVDKCILVCPNCHRIEHNRMEDEGSYTGHRDGWFETEEGLGSGDEGYQDQRSFDFEESNT